MVLMLYHSLAFEKRDDGKALGTAGRPCKLEPYHGCCHWIRHRNVKLRAGFRDMVGIREVFEKRVPFQVRGVQWLDKTFATDRGRRNNELDHQCWKLAVLRKRSQVDP